MDSAFDVTTGMLVGVSIGVTTVEDSVLGANWTVHARG